jgi:hypothetical protein
MKQFSSFSAPAEDRRTWPFGQRRASERLPSRLDVSVSRHRSDTVTDHVAANVSNGGMMLEPAVDGYVGEHLFLDGGTLFSGLEARITHQYGDATGIAFVQRVDRPDVASAATES